MTKPYQPIDCGVYDELEVIAMRKTQCEIQFTNQDEKTEIVQSRIEDVFARNGEEFIRIEDNRTIRLDRLHLIDGKPIGGSCAIKG